MLAQKITHFQLFSLLSQGKESIKEDRQGGGSLKPEGGIHGTE